MYSQCDEETKTQKVFFFYPTTLNCDPTKQEND